MPTKKSQKLPRKGEVLAFWGLLGASPFPFNIVQSSCVGLCERFMSFARKASAYSSRILNGCLHPLGIEVRRPGKDVFADQRRLLSGQTVSAILDVGANKGQTAVKYKKVFPGATIYCFEPFPPSYHALCEKFQHDPTVKPFQFAVSEASGSVSFYSNQNSLTNSTLPTAAGAYDWCDPGLIATLDRLEVPAITLDDFCSQKNLGGIAVLKMDVQGGELNALKSARQLLARQQIQLIQLEINFVPLYEGQASYLEILNFMAEWDYSLFDFYHAAYGKSGQLSWCDGLFVSSAMRDRIVALQSS